MIINSFFSKNNTLIKNSRINTGKNPIIEMFYGGENAEFSRYIFQIDITKLKEYYMDGNFPAESTTHTINFVNTNFFDYRINKNKFNGMDRVSTIELELHLVGEDFSEGYGYDFKRSGFTVGKEIISEMVSNFYNSAENQPWEIMNRVDFKHSIHYESRVIGTGSYCNGEEVLTEKEFPVLYNDATQAYSSLIDSVQFHSGVENISFDVTKIINSMLDGTISERQTFVIKFPNRIENLKTDNKHYLGLFGRHADSAYCPYLQSYNSEPIKDSRNNFLLHEPNRLYYYNYVNGRLTNLAELPTATIVTDPDMYYYNPIDNQSNTTLAEYTLCGDSKVKQAGKGIYYIEFTLNDEMVYLGQEDEDFSQNDDTPFQNKEKNTYNVSDCSMLYDIWGIIDHRGALKQVEQTFTPLNNYDEEYTPSHLKDLSVNFRGITNHSRLNRGELRDFYVIMKEKYSYNKIMSNNTVFATVYSKEGNAEIIVFDNIELDTLLDGSKRLKVDTSSFLPNTYFVDVTIDNGNEIKVLKEAVSFYVIGEKNFRLNTRNPRP